MTSSRWQKRPEGSNWGEFGPDDQLGRLNLITREKVRAGLAEARAGGTFCLSLPLDIPRTNALNPRRHPPVLRPTRRGDMPNFNCCPAPGLATDIVCDDFVVLHTQYSTQWDALSHMGQMFDANGDGEPEMVYYNGFRANIDIVGPSGEVGTATAEDLLFSTSSARRLGIEEMAVHGVQGRAVMIDLRHHFGDERRLIGYEELQRVIEADRIEIETGDMVCFHTGFADLLLKSETEEGLDDSCAVMDGSDPRLLDWITTSGLSIIAADNYAVEGLPARGWTPGHATAPLHEHCLFKLGIHLGELWWLTPLAAWLRDNNRSRFLLTAPPLRLPGAVGSPVTPIATV
jgi:kynurenine formamidase